MKKLLFGLAFLGLFTFAKAETNGIIDLSEGIVNSVDSSRIPDNAVSESQNVYFDKTTMAEKRKGMIALNTSALGDANDRNIYGQFEFVKSNGTRYHIVQSSSTIYYRTSGNTFSIVTTVNSKTYPTNYCVFMDTLQFCNGVSNLRNWDTSRIGTTTTSYQPRYIIAWSNRLCIAGDGDELSKVRFSEWLAPNDFAIPASNALSTDPVVFDINSQDGQKVMGFFTSPNGNLGILKEKSTWEISGNDRDDYSLRLVNNDIGCISDGSISYKEGDVYWLSSKGFVRYNGNSISVISDNIQNTVYNIQQLNVGVGSFSKNSQSEWETYTSTNNIVVTDKIMPIQLYEQVGLYGADINIVKTTTNKRYIFYGYGSIYIELFDPTNTNTDGITGIDTIDTNSYFVGSHFSDIDSTNIIYIAYYKYDATYYDLYVSSASSPYTSWSPTKIQDNCFQTVGGARTASIDIDGSDYPHILYTYSPTGYDKIKYAYNIGAGWVNNDFITAGDSWEYISMIIDSTNKMQYAVTYYSSPNYTLYRGLSVTGVSFSSALTSLETGTDFYKYLDIALDNSNNYYISCSKNTSKQTRIYTGAATSRLINTLTGVCKTSIKNINNIIYMSYGSYIDKKLYCYNYASNKSYLLYENQCFSSDIEGTENNQAIIPFIEDNGSSGTAAVLYSTSSYISEIHDMGNSSYNFDNLITVQSLGDYNINHYIRGDITSACVSTHSWTAMTPGSIISLTPRRYIQYKCHISTDIPSINLGYVDQIIINYHSTAGATRLSSMCYDKRIWNAVSKDEGTYLDRQLILDSNGKWTDFTSTKHCMNLLNYAGTPYFGDDAGIIYQLDQGNDDNGDAIESYFKTKTYVMSNNLALKTFDNLYVEALSQGAWDLNLDYYLDRSPTSTATNTIDLDETANYINKKIPISEQIPFYSFQFKVSNNNADEFWQLLGLYYDYRSIAQR